MDTISQSQKLFLARLATGLFQGLVLYLLYRAQDSQAWPATSGAAFAPLLMAWLYAPILLILSLGSMAWRRAALWAAIAALMIGVLAFFDQWSSWPQDWQIVPGKTGNLAFRWVPHILPSAELFFFGGGGLFIAHALVTGGDADRRFMARYATHFDVAWKLAVQLALAALFVGAFWLLLWLGAGLFKLIKLDFFEKLITHEWFAIPVTTLAAAGALHLTDIRPALVQGARTLLLTLLSWLLPLIALIVAGFVASLPFTGLAPLWGFGHASALLLVAASALIVLINAAHQDGAAERLPPKILRWTATLAAVLTLPLVIIAWYALFLRVQQYGWTDDRVIVAAIVVVALAYAGGYVRAALARGPWLQRIENWNFYVSLLILVLLVALFTPIASPARIAAADQMARLDSGRVSPEKFDYSYLRWNGGRYGQAALETLSRDKRAFVQQSAREALKAQDRYSHPLLPPAGSLARRVAVYPKGARLPQNFFLTKPDSDPSSGEWPTCMTSVNFRCDAIAADLDGDGRDEIILVEQEPPVVSGVIFREEAGAWRLEGLLDFPANCGNVPAELRAGRFTPVPAKHAWRDILVEGGNLHIKDSIGLPSLAACAKPAPH